MKLYVSMIIYVYTNLFGRLVWAKEVAATLADKVVVVTNAEEGWVNLSCRVGIPRGIAAWCWAVDWEGGLQLGQLTNLGYIKVILRLYRWYTYSWIYL